MHAEKEPVGVELRSSPTDKFDQHIVSELCATGKQHISGWRSGVPERSESVRRKLERDRAQVVPQQVSVDSAALVASRHYGDSGPTEACR
jgi:hypothetical protein